MKNVVDQLYAAAWLLVILFTFTSSTDPDSKHLDQHTIGERTGRSWHHALFGAPLPGAAPSVSTSQPGGDNNISPGSQQPQGNPAQTDQNRNFEDIGDKNNLPAASEQDLMSRQFGYLNVHRFDPNNMYYNSRNIYPRYPSPQTPRFGPGYRKDKYGHGYGYSCKQGDDCDEVRAANQVLAAAPNPPPFGGSPSHHPQQQHPFSSNNPYADMMSAFPGMPSFGPYPASLFPPARFNDPHASLMPPNMMAPQSHSQHGLHHQQQMMMPPSRFYHARYLHDQVEEDHQQEQQKEASPE